jgi:hypothetical protein
METLGRHLDSCVPCGRIQAGHMDIVRDIIKVIIGGEGR